MSAVPPSDFPPTGGFRAPPPPPPSLSYAAYDQVRRSDDSQLNTLRILHYVWGGLCAAFSCLFLIHIIMGAAIVGGAFNPPPTTAPTPVGAAPRFPAAFGWMFIIMGAIALLMGWATAICNFVSARAIAQRKWRVFSIVVSAVNCMAMPLGTALGVFTLVVLLRESVAAQYGPFRGDPNV
jgi:hypothetical protein